MQKEVRPIRKGEYKYPYRLELRLNETQIARLQSLASKSGLSMSAYVRRLIDGVLPQERPPFDFYLILSQLRYIGNNMNQLTRIAHATGRIAMPAGIPHAVQAVTAFKMYLVVVKTPSC